MEMKSFALTLGLGAAAGAVAVMMLPRQCTARRMAHMAAEKVEDAAAKVADTITGKTGSL